MTDLSHALSAIRIGPTARFNDLSLTALLRSDTVEPDYLLLDKALEAGLVEVREVSLEGSVPDLMFTNRATRPVLLLDGEELVGAKQNRILNLTVMAPAGQSLVIPVSCVEAGRWHHASDQFSSAGRTLYASGRARKAEQVSCSLRETSTRRSRQGEIWDDLADKIARMSVASETSAMSDIFEDREAALNDYTAAFAPERSQVGLVVAIRERFVTIDLFDAPATLARMLPRLVRSYALDVLDQRSEAPECRVDEAAAAIEAVRAARSDAYPAIGMGADVRFASTDVIGGALAIENRLLHLCAFPSATPDPGYDASSGGRIAGVHRRRAEDGDEHRHPLTDEPRARVPTGVVGTVASREGLPDTPGAPDHHGRGGPAMTVKLLHTSDWQIGRQFSQVPGDPGAALRTQRIDTVGTLARIANEHQVDAVLVAGDVLEHSAVGDETLRRMLRQMETYSGPWVLLPGNHDAAHAGSVWTRLARAPFTRSNVHLAVEPQPIELLGGRLLVLPAPLRKRHEAQDLTAWFDTADSAPGVCRIGIAHGGVTNHLPEAAESRNFIDDNRAASARLDYLALGDWHGTLQVNERCWYSGTPEPDRFKDNDPGNALLVDIPATGAVPAVTPIRTARFAWKAIDSRLDAGSAVAALEHLLAGIDESTVLRLRLSGSLGLAERTEVDEAIATWRAASHYLDADLSGLMTSPTDEDLATMQATGFVAAAIEDLREAMNGGDHQAAVAREALRILFHETRRGGV